MIAEKRVAVFRPISEGIQVPVKPRLRPAMCPYCHSWHTIAKGYREAGGRKKPIQKCKDCGRKFTPKLKPLEPAWSTAPCIGCKEIETCEPETCSDLGRWVLRTS